MSGKVFTYDSENHLKTMNGGAVTLVYDGDGNRVAKTANGVTTRYLVDDLNPTGYAQVVEEVAGGAVHVVRVRATEDRPESIHQQYLDDELLLLRWHGQRAAVDECNRGSDG
jgi:YD repeat-containing protein